MRNSRDRGTAGMIAVNRALNPRMLLVLALLALGAAGFSSAVHAATKNPDVQAGVAAFEAGAFPIALAKLEPLAKAGNPEAAYWLGRMYEGGLGVKKNIDQAIAYYSKAAKAGWQDAKQSLGEIYFHGTEVLQNFDKAHKWLERAAFDGLPLAQRDLGSLYANGWGIQKDPVWAYVWYEFAAKQGDYEAQKMRDSLLGTMTADQITEAQKLTQKIAPEVFGQVRDKSSKAPDNADKAGHGPKASTHPPS